MTPQDKVPKCIPPSFYAACVADMDEQKLDDHLRDPYLAVAFLSAVLRAKYPGTPELLIERVGKLLARHFAQMTEICEPIWRVVEYYHDHPMALVLWLINDSQPDDT